MPFLIPLLPYFAAATTGALTWDWFTDSDPIQTPEKQPIFNYTALVLGGVGILLTYNLVKKSLRK